MTFDPSNALHFGHGLFLLNLAAIGHFLAIWPMDDLCWGHFEIMLSWLGGLPPYPIRSFSSVPQSMTKYLARYIPIQTPLISNFNILTYLNVSTNRTPLMTFDPNIPTHFTLPLLQGISTPHMNLIRLCVKKIWTTQKACTKSLTHWHTKHAAIRSFLTDDLKMKITVDTVNSLGSRSKIKWILQMCALHIFNKLAHKHRPIDK